MSTSDLITATLAAFAAVTGFIIEWRRLGARDEQVAALEERVSNLEQQLAAVLARHDRIDRAR